MSTDPREPDSSGYPPLEIDTSRYSDPVSGYFGDDEPVKPEDLGTFIVVDDDGRAEITEVTWTAAEDPDDEDSDDDDGVEYQLIFINVDDPRYSGYARPQPPLGLSEQVTARRLMAQQLADALADPPYRLEGGGHDWADAAMQVPVTYPPVRRMLAEVEQVTEAAILVPGETWVATAYEGGDYGMVYRVHGPSWSLVFTSHGTVTAVYVCSDDITEVPLKVKLDDRAMTLASVMMFKVFSQLRRISIGGDKASFNPNLAHQG